jgi:ADP-heptose:LPS heptosyltransferase
MESWGYKLLNLDCGIGDHYAFLNVLPELKKKYNHLIIGACFPEIFKDHPDITLIHIAESAPVNPENIYKWMGDNKWTGSLVDAYATFYGVRE